MNKEESKRKILELVEKYQRVKIDGRVKQYNEAQTRNEFIEPLFSYLGWDMRNIENENEVTTEEKISRDRVDLAFRINGIPKFFLEAKSLKTDLNLEQYARQAINYSWNKSVTWAVLTDFESIKIFNAQSESRNLSDKLVFEIAHEEFISDFDRLWLLSKESFNRNELDIYAEKYGKKQKSLTVNEKLYGDLKNARQLLAKSFDSWNKNISSEDLDEGVQRILDRLIFIRVLEDRELESPILKPLIRLHEQDGQKQIFQMLKEKFRELDDIYDSSLFKLHACEQWEEYDDSIKKVISLLYGNDVFTYDFKEIPADILGGVYESYLGYISQKKGTDLVKDGAKRKEQGIFYTPNYIVDFIVKGALGEKLKEIRNINDLQKIKVLDPASGSGSFLTAAFETINDKYKNFGNSGDLFTKTNILLKNIYGVDLDKQAIELAKLNLLIGALDFKAKLPDLTNNIRIGNSLISEGETELSPFNWQEQFKDVFDQGGFDVIVGNPPYIKEYTNKSAFDGLHNDPYYQGKMDIWTLFACRSMDLLKEDGYLGFIAPSNWLTNAGASIFRNKILTDGEIVKFVDFGDFKVFEHAGIQTMIFIFHKKKPRNAYKVLYSKVTDSAISSQEVNRHLASAQKEKVEGIETFEVLIKPEELINKTISFSNSSSSSLINNIKKISNYYLNNANVAQGIVFPQDFVQASHLPKIKNESVKTGDGIFVLKNDYIGNLNLDISEKQYLKPYYTSRQVNRYLSIKNTDQSLIYADKNFKENIDQSPNIKKHLDKFKNVITSDFAPYGLHRSRNENFFLYPSIFSLRKTAFPAFSFVDFPCYVSQSYFVIQPKDINLKYLTGLLNSKVVYFWLKNKGKKQGDQLQIDKEPLLEIPLIKTTPEKEQPIIELVDKIMMLNKQLGETTPDTDKYNELKKEIVKIDHKIDEEAYKIYGLNNNEIKIIEGN